MKQINQNINKLQVEINECTEQIENFDQKQRNSFNYVNRYWPDDALQHLQQSQNATAEELQRLRDREAQDQESQYQQLSSKSEGKQEKQQQVEQKQRCEHEQQEYPFQQRQQEQQNDQQQEQNYFLQSQNQHQDCYTRRQPGMQTPKKRVISPHASPEVNMLQIHQISPQRQENQRNADLPPIAHLQESRMCSESHCSPDLKIHQLQQQQSQTQNQHDEVNEEESLKKTKDEVQGVENQQCLQKQEKNEKMVSQCLAPSFEVLQSHVQNQCVDNGESSSDTNQKIEKDEKLKTQKYQNEYQNKCQSEYQNDCNENFDIKNPQKDAEEVKIQNISETPPEVLATELLVTEMQISYEKIRSLHSSTADRSKQKQQSREFDDALNNCLQCQEILCDVYSDIEDTQLPLYGSKFYNIQESAQETHISQQNQLELQSDHTLLQSEIITQPLSFHESIQQDYTLGNSAIIHDQLKYSIIDNTVSGEQPSELLNSRSCNFNNLANKLQKSILEKSQGNTTSQRLTNKSQESDYQDTCSESQSLRQSLSKSKQEDKQTQTGQQGGLRALPSENVSITNKKSHSEVETKPQ